MSVVTCWLHRLAALANSRVLRVCDPLRACDAWQYVSAEGQWMHQDSSVPDAKLSVA